MCGTRLLSSLLIAAALPGCSGIPSPDPTPRDTMAMQCHLDTEVPGLMQQFNVPGVAIAIVDEDGPLILAGYGHSDAENTDPVDEYTVFQGASLGIVVLTNGDNGLELATRLVPAVFGTAYPFLQFPMLHPDD